MHLQGRLFMFMDKNSYVPNHIAIILDGNGRWAASMGKPRVFGHREGAKNVERICRAAKAAGVSYLTLYAFSTENWKRATEEVNAIMALLSEYLKNCLKLSKENDMRVRVIGDRSQLAPDMVEKIEELEEKSRDYKGFNLTVAINYGSRDEIIRAVKKIKEDTNVSSDMITEDYFSSCLDTASLPDPDLLIRTGGEERLSNFLLWQLSYSEFVFTKTPWPAFDEAELNRCIDIYKERNRRYGGI